MTDAPAGARRTRGSRSFWSAVVGVPALLSVLRLGVEAGGEPQTTLLLVANVDPINLIAALFTTAARYASAGLVATFAVGGVLLVSTPTTGDRRPALFTRWTESVPVWFVVAGFLLAAITWDLLYLPLLLPCAAAAAQDLPGLPGLTHRRKVLLAAVLLIGYAWLVGPTVADAAGQGEGLVVALFTLPPLLALGVPGPLPRRLVPLLAVTAQTAILVMMLWAAVPVLTTPVLPLTVTRIRGADGAGGENIRGHVVAVDDVSMVILQERGGVRYVPVDRVESQVLCPSEDELPRYRLWVRGFHVEDSLLQGLGRHVRPVNRLDAHCRGQATG